jgi:hypothetical protein
MSRALRDERVAALALDAGLSCIEGFVSITKHRYMATNASLLKALIN